ncbi:MAG: ABC transporter permease [Candidatus Brocadiia bacterium]
MSHTRAIAWREFTTTVRRPTYIVATLGTPLFFLVIAGITAVPSVLALRRELAERREVAVVDRSGLLTGQGAGAEGAEPGPSQGVLEELMTRVVGGEEGSEPTAFLSYETEERAVKDLRAGVIESFYLVPEDYVETGEIEYRSRRRQMLWSPAGRGSPLRSLLVAGLLRGRLAEERQTRAQEPIERVRTLVLGPEGDFKEQDPREALARIVVPFAFAFILMLSIFISSGYLIQGLVEERSNRVIELLLSSVRPGELIAGKLLGLGGAGLLQLAVWVSVAMMPVLLVGWFEVSPAVVALSVLYYLAGFVFYGSVMAGLGCLSSGTQESQQFASLWSVVAVIPMLFSPMILESPNGVLSRVLSYVPLTTPITMIMRCAAAEVAWWEVPLSMAVMLVAIVVSLRLSARLFRVGLLLQGQRPALGELLAHLREA